MNAVQTKHNLDFEACPWDLDPNIALFRIGTCHGQYMFTKDGLEIISIINNEKGNGHLEDVFEWFEYAARTQKLKLWIRAFMNDRFKKHCIEKRGFKASGDEDVVKEY